MFELFCSTGGRGGVFQTLQGAIAKAHALMDGYWKEHWVDIRRSSAGEADGYAQVMRVYQAAPSSRNPATAPTRRSIPVVERP